MNDMRQTRRYSLTGILGVLILGVLLLAGNPVQADSFKHVSDLVGARPNQLVGYGIVVGLNGTGDGAKAEFTLQSVAAMLRRLGVRVDPTTIKIKNVAAVIVTAELPPFAAPGQKLDITVSSLGDSKSLRGGTLIQTPLRGADRQVYAVAQGPVSVGGATASGSGASKTANHPTVGRVPGGALIEREIRTSIAREDSLRFALKSPSFFVAADAVAKINETLGGNYAKAHDAGNITVRVPPKYKKNTVELIALVGNVNVANEGLAKIVINERTGTVVAGSEVRLRPAAIAHGGLTVEITEETEVVQPKAPLAGGETVEVENTDVELEFAPGDLHYIPETTSVGDLVNALNTLGVKPSDMIVIFQSLKTAGAINAEIEVQ
ncbi:MAG: flagellar basal body P-ring protein FlgI [Deltaproteobacteria bacterium]|nr:flagellar basal body P-ring protein FlgI [Deltaproteobacteria bacterium]MBN2674735.1 flagellar basal body P-ring protein FlgI [Deltaproteobacteria bacterium]